MKNNLKHKRPVKPLHSYTPDVFDKKELITLLENYASEAQKKQFEEGLEQHPISSILINPKVSVSNNSLQGLKQDEEDKLLYRFDKEEDRMGKTLLHFGGAFYILDPSSAAISYYLAPLLKKNALGIDLCAAPGGKSISLSFRRPDVFLVSNDISYKRALEITHNTDRLGLTNIVSTSLDPMKLRLSSLFDFVILDAPCSGSGMVRKEPKMLEDYSEEKVDRLLPIQEDLLEKSYELLNKDGILAYSTCSLSEKEDEEQVKKILKKHPDLEIIKVDVSKDIIKAKKDLGYHMVPGIYQGEGIYFIFLRKTTGNTRKPEEVKYKKEPKEKNLHLVSYKKNEYLVDRMYADLVDLPFIAPGIKIYDDSDHPKCEFDHAYSKVASTIKTIELTKEQALQFASGNEVTIHGDYPDDLYIVTYDSMRLGFTKKVKNKLKNHLPKGLRMNLID